MYVSSIQACHGGSILNKTSNKCSQFVKHLYQNVTLKGTDNNKYKIFLGEKPSYKNQEKTHTKL